MKCPYCGSACQDTAIYCPSCKQPLPTSSHAEEEKEIKAPHREHHSVFHKIAIALCWVAGFAALGIGIYKLVFWIDNYQLTRLYTRGAYAPTISTINMDDRRQGHAVVFYGEDGDQIFLPEMNKSLTISGGVARLEVADSDWFTDNVNDVEYADISLSPMLIEENGAKTQLPLLNFQIDVPPSPLDVINPSDDRISVVTSEHPLELEVVPGSTVFVNGEDVTPSVDRSGLFTSRVRVEPIGDNIITIIVRTPKHQETRKELIIYREDYDIELELDTSVSTRSSSRTMAVTGKAEPGAYISVDTDHIAESLSIDMETGEFSFIAKFSALGDNIVRFRATKDGKEDAVISFTVYYLPTLAEYSAGAWRMDYKQLRVLFEQWNGRVFQCKGEIVDVINENNASYIVMDVGDEEQQLVVLENLTSIKSPTLGRSYEAWADVNGRYMYQANYYPLLKARYMDLAAATN